MLVPNIDKLLLLNYHHLPPQQLVVVVTLWQRMQLGQLLLVIGLVLVLQPVKFAVAVSVMPKVIPIPLCCNGNVPFGCFQNIVGFGFANCLTDIEPTLSYNGMQLILQRHHQELIVYIISVVILIIIIITDDVFCIISTIRCSRGGYCYCN